MAIALGVSTTAPSLSGLARQSAVAPLPQMVFTAPAVRHTSAAYNGGEADPRVEPEDDGGWLGWAVECRPDVASKMNPMISVTY